MRVQCRGTPAATLLAAHLHTGVTTASHRPHIRADAVHHRRSLVSDAQRPAHNHRRRGDRRRRP